MTPTGSIHPACELCRGACCEIFGLDPRQWGWPDDVCRWLEFHGEPSPIGILIDKPCCKLVGGKCSIYETRPAMCAKWPVGCQACRDCIKLRRPEQEAEILALLP